MNKYFLIVALLMLTACNSSTTIVVPIGGEVPVPISVPATATPMPPCTATGGIYHVVRQQNEAGNVYFIPSPIAITLPGDEVAICARPDEAGAQAKKLASDFKTSQPSVSVFYGPPEGPFTEVKK